ncbi:glycosyltransferase family 39 protein [Candidatus Wolfebacteria bacterium]|nr:glycosyltransferase family 39 protein [Candidatus Wolfebacteria bacterium]
MSKKSAFLLFIIIIIASFFRLYNITELPPGLYPDEAMNGNNALEALSPSGQFKLFYPENNGREGLFINIQTLAIKLLGNEPWALRSVSSIFGILTILGIYFLTKELFKKNSHGDAIALLSSFFIATSFWHINFSRIGFRAIMAPFFLTWAIYFLLKSFNNLEKRNLLFLSLAGGIFYGLGFYSYIAYRATPLLILIIIALYWLQNKDKQIRRKIFISASCFLIFTFIVAAPLGIYFLKNPQDFFGRTAQISIFNSQTPLKDLGSNVLKTATMFNFKGDLNWRHNIAGAPLLFWPVGILFLIGIVLSARKFFKKNNIIIFSWLAVAALPVIISNEGMPHALRAILMAPAVFIFAGIGGIYVYQTLKNFTDCDNNKIKKALLNYSIIIFLIILIFDSYISYFYKWGKNPEVAGSFNQNYVNIGRQLNSLPKELKKYVIIEAGGILVRGIPMPTQTIMFITDTFTSEKQKEKNIYYILPSETNIISENDYKIILK